MAETDQAEKQHELTANLYGVDEVLSAMQKCIRRGLRDETLFWTAELEQSGLGLLALARFGVIIPEDCGVGAPASKIQASLSHHFSCSVPQV